MNFDLYLGSYNATVIHFSHGEHWYIGKKTTAFQGRLCIWDWGLAETDNLYNRLSKFMDLYRVT